MNVPHRGDPRIRRPALVIPGGGEHCSLGVRMRRWPITWLLGLVFATVALSADADPRDNGIVRIQRLRWRPTPPPRWPCSRRAPAKPAAATTARRHGTRRWLVADRTDATYDKRVLLVSTVQRTRDRAGAARLSGATAKRVRSGPGPALFASRAGVPVPCRRAGLCRHPRCALSVAGGGTQRGGACGVRPEPPAGALRRRWRAGRRVPGGAGVLAGAARPRLPAVFGLHGDATAVRAVRVRRGVCVAGAAPARALLGARRVVRGDGLDDRVGVLPARFRRVAGPHAAPRARPALDRRLPAAAVAGVARRSVAGRQGLVPECRQPVAAARQRARDREPVHGVASRRTPRRDDAAGVDPAGARLDRARRATEFRCAVAAVARVRLAAGARLHRSGADAGDGRSHACVPP